MPTDISQRYWSVVIRRVSRAKRSRKAVAEFVDGWDQEIAQHFADEERLLLDVMSDADRDRMLEEHRQLRDFAAQARQLRKQTDPDADLVRRIGQTLNDHIRWEERDLFTRIQDDLNDEQLAFIQQHTEPIEASRPRNACRTEPAEHAGNTSDAEGAS